MNPDLISQSEVWPALVIALLVLVAWQWLRLRRIAGSLQTELEKWRIFASVSLDGILIHEDLIALDVNDEFGRLFGYSREELIGSDIRRFIAPRSMDLVNDRIRIKYQGRYSIFGLRKDGSQFPLEIAAAQLNYQGREIRAVVVRDLSSYRRQQKILGQLSGVVEQMPVAIFVLDRQARIEWTNPAFTLLAGYGENALKGRRIASILGASEAAQDTLNWESPGEESSWQCDTPARREDGSCFQAHVAAFPLHAASGIVDGYAGVILDITEQTDTTQALDDLQQTLAMVERLSHVAHWSWDLHSDQVLWSEEMYRIAGLDPQSFGGNRDAFLARILPADRALVSGKIQQCMEQKSTVEFEYRIVRPDGQIRDQYSINHPILDPKTRQVLRMVGTNQDISQRKRAQQAILKLAYTDPLTGLPNRNRFVERLGVLVRQGDSGICQGLLLINVDDFKTFNDNYGRTIGDQLLSQVGARLRATCREGDLLARLDGDEYALFRPQLGRPGEINTLAATLLATVAAPFDLGHGEHPIRITVGANVLSGKLADVSEIMRQTDLALHHAKQHNLGGFKAYNPVLDRQLKARTQLEAELARAIEEDQLFLEYQPQVEISHGRIIGFEALVRWRHPTEGRISPSRFIPLAEESGLIAGLGIWVLRAAAQQLRIWLDEEIAPDHVAVNLSPLQFDEADLADQILAITRAADVPSERIELELTESTHMGVSTSYQEVLKHLQKHGFRFSIDDFGTGYSSMQYLRRLPVYKIKIAQEFVRDMLDDPADMEIVRATIAIARSFGLEVIAEGVETLHHANQVREMGCEQIQGYLYSRPVSAEAAGTLLRAGRIELQASPTREKGVGAS